MLLQAPGERLPRANRSAFWDIRLAAVGQPSFILS